MPVLGHGRLSSGRPLTLIVTVRAMRKLITGVDANGQSVVIEEADVVSSAVEGIPGLSRAMLYRTDVSPPLARPPGLAERYEVNLPPGHIRWMVIDHAPPATYEAPNQTAVLHHTDSLNFVCVQQGSVDFHLQGGEHSLHPGDCVVITGVDHAYTAGPEGCRLLVVTVGTPRP